MKAVDDGETFEDGIWYKERWINENGIEQRIIVSFSPKIQSLSEIHQKAGRLKELENQLKVIRKQLLKTLTALQDSFDEVRYTDNGEVADNVK